MLPAEYRGAEEHQGMFSGFANPGQTQVPLEFLSYPAQKLG